MAAGSRHIHASIAIDGGTGTDTCRDICRNHSGSGPEYMDGTLCGEEEAPAAHGSNPYRRCPAVGTPDPINDVFGDAWTAAVCGGCRDVTQTHKSGIHILPNTN